MPPRGPQARRALRAPARQRGWRHRQMPDKRSDPLVDVLLRDIRCIREIQYRGLVLRTLEMDNVRRVNVLSVLGIHPIRTGALQFDVQ